MSCQAGELTALLQVIIDVARRNLRTHFPEARVLAVAGLICSVDASSGRFVKGPFMAWPRKLQLMMVAALLHVDVFPTSVLHMLPVAAHCTTDAVVAHRLLSVVVHAGERVSLEDRVGVLLSAALASPVHVYPRVVVGEPYALPPVVTTLAATPAVVKPETLDVCCEHMRALAVHDVPGRSGPRSMLRYCAAVSAEVLRGMHGRSVGEGWLQNLPRQECASLNVGLARALLRLLVASVPPCAATGGGDDSATQAAATAVPWLAACVLGADDAWHAADVRLCEALVKATGTVVVHGLARFVHGDRSGPASAGASLPVPLDLEDFAVSQIQVPAARALTLLVRRGVVVVDAAAPATVQALCTAGQPVLAPADSAVAAPLEAAVQQLRSACHVASTL